MEEKIPNGVVDKEAYIEWQQKIKNPILTTKRDITCSDGTEVHLALFPHILKKRIQHLPLDEQNSILKKKELYFRINNKATQLKRRAFGDDFKGQKGGMLGSREPEVIEYFGRMFSIDEVFKIINEDWGIQLGKQAIERFRKNHAEEIDRKIEEFKASYSDIRLGVKRSRLEELVWLYTRQKDKYINTDSRDDYKLMLTTLEAIRKESEGDRLTIDGKLDISYEENIQVHLRQEIFKTLNLKEIILARVAARMSVNPVKLIFSLNNSFYKKFSNVLGDYDENNITDTDQTFPSQMSYNFEKIQKYHQERDKDIDDAVIVDEQTNGKSQEEGIKKKLTLAEKIKQKRAAVSRSNSEVNANSAIYNKKKT